MKLTHAIAALAFAAGATPSFAIEGVYSGTQCANMKFDFHGDGQLFITEVSGRESPAKYKVSGDKIAVDTMGSGPGFVLTLQGDSVQMKVPAILGKPGKTLVCSKPFESASYVSDPRVIGCWQQTRLLVYKDETSPPKESNATACHVLFEKSTYTSVCTPPGKSPATTVAKVGVLKPGLMATEVVRSEAFPQTIGMRANASYAVSGDTMERQIFPREINPDNTTAPWKFDYFFKRADAAVCR